MDPGPNAAVTFSDLPESEGLAWASKMLEQSTAISTAILTYPAYKHIPVTYLVCERDKVLHPEYQRAMVGMVAKESGREVDVQSCSSGHCPNASMPERVVEVVRMAAGEHLSATN